MCSISWNSPWFVPLTLLVVSLIYCWKWINFELCDETMKAKLRDFNSFFILFSRIQGLGQAFLRKFLACQPMVRPIWNYSILISFLFYDIKTLIWNSFTILSWMMNFPLIYKWLHHDLMYAAILFPYFNAVIFHTYM